MTSILEDLATGHRTALFENRGRGARGCRLDEAALAEATARVEGSFEHAPHLLVLNKFGKVECDGGGLRDLIANAIDSEIPVVIGVPRRNLAPGEISRANSRLNSRITRAKSNDGWTACGSVALHACIRLGHVLRGRSDFVIFSRSRAARRSVRTIRSRA